MTSWMCGSFLKMRSRNTKEEEEEGLMEGRTSPYPEGRVTGFLENRALLRTPPDLSSCHGPFPN